MIDNKVKAKNFIDSKLKFPKIDKKIMMNFLRNQIIVWQAEIDQLKYLNPFEEKELELIEIKKYKECLVQYGQEVLRLYHDETNKKKCLY